jgi:hypothetical protein
MDSEVITAKWKSVLDAREDQVGFINLRDYKIRFPIIDSPEDINPNANLLWGLTEKLARCTALILPFRAHGSVSREVPGTLPSTRERLFNATARLTHLLIGSTYISDPTSNFVREISFVPKPNRILHVNQLFRYIQPTKDIAGITFAESCDAEKQAFASALLAYFRPDRSAVFETLIPSIGATLTGHLVPGGISGKQPNREGKLLFSIRYSRPSGLQAAIEDADVVCVFLSFIAHQYIRAAEFQVLTDGERQSHRLHFRQERLGSKPRNSWVRHTLVVPDENPVEFVELVQRWYATNKLYLRSRYLYRYSMRAPYVLSNERFLAVFQALEGLLRMPSHQLLTEEEFRSAENAVREALSSSERLQPFLRRLPNSNVKSPSAVLKQELPRLFSEARLLPTFDVTKVIDKVYSRRNRASHGGSHLDRDSFDDLLQHTLLITFICLLIEAQQLGLNAHDCFRKFEAAMLTKLPFSVADNAQPRKL